MTSLVDLFPAYLRQGCRRELLLLAFCCTCCLLGFSMVTEVREVHSELLQNPFLGVFCRILRVALNVLETEIQQAKYRKTARVTKADLAQ